MTTIPDIKNKAQEIFETKAQELVVDNYKAIREKVDKLLEEATSNWIAKFLGFDKRWSHDEWEVDHCNGRSGESFVCNDLRIKVAKLTEEWMDKNFKVPKMNAQQLRSLQKEYGEQRDRYLRQRMEELAKQEVDRDFDQMMQQVVTFSPDDSEYETYLKLKRKFDSGPNP